MSFSLERWTPISTGGLWRTEELTREHLSFSFPFELYPTFHLLSLGLKVAYGSDVIGGPSGNFCLCSCGIAVDLKFVSAGSTI